MGNNEEKEKKFSEEYVVIDDIIIEKSLMDEVDEKIKKRWTVIKKDVDI